MKNLFFAFFLITALSSHAQIIKGTVSEVNEAVPFVNVVVKKFKTPAIIYKYATTDENGAYEISLPNYQDSLIVEVSSAAHDPQQKNIFGTLNKNAPTILNFNLQKRITSLKEVIIKAKEKPVTVKGDTTTYNPDSFKDGSEKVIEDLLKKLPGIKVTADGEIKFKGKTIKKMLLDGDDLFDTQYKIGSKNISIDVVDKVQAIEDFNENPLLKGLKDSDEVALNIKLKKGKTDFSGNANIGYGIKDRHDTSLSGLLINTKSKSFGLASYNSIGNNPSPYNIESDILSDGTASEENLKAREIIRQGSFYSPLENQYSNLNKNLYSSLNTLFKLSKEVSSRVNFGFYSDEMSRKTINQSNYTIDAASFTVNQSENAIKKPNIFNANLQLLDKNSKNHNWEYIGKVKINSVDFNAETINNDIVQTNNVKTRTFFTKHNFNYSLLIDDRKALVLSGLYSKSNAPQKYVVTPGTALDGGSSQADENQQESTFKKETLLLNSDFFGKYGSYKWDLNTGILAVQNNFNSSLALRSNDNIIFPDNFYNDTDYKSFSAFSKLEVALVKKKFSIKAGLGLQYYNLSLKDNSLNILDDNRQLTVSPTFKFTHKISKRSSLSYNYSFSQTTPNEANLYEGLVQTGFRTFQNNNLNLEFLKAHNFGLGFTYSDAFNINRFTAIANYCINKNNYFTESAINQDTTTFSSFLLNNKSDSYNFILSSGAYLHPIKTTVDFDLNYDISFFNDIVNNSDLRNVTSKSLNVELTMRKEVKKMFYFETKTVYFNNDYLLQNESKNKLNSLKQALKIAYNSKESFKANATMNFISSDLAINNNYWFINSEISFTSKNKKIEYSIVGKNLTNNEVFATYSITDYSKAMSSQNLIKRYVLASVNFKF